MSRNEISTPRWEIKRQTDQKSKDRQIQFGDALIGIANTLRSLNTMTPGWPTIRRAGASMSVHVAKILFDGNPLINCVEKPKLPALPDNGTLCGDVHNLSEPLIFSLSPPESGPGTGLSICNMGAVFPLHGMSYDAASNRFVTRRPWGSSSLHLSQWGRQNLVQVCGTVLTIQKVLSDIRNQRGAHTDVKWIQDHPQPVRQFYALYASWFVMEVGLHLVRQATLAVENETFRRSVFGTHAELPVMTDIPLPSGGTPLSIESDKLDLKFADSMNLLHVPHQGHGTMSYSAALWFIRAPGDTTEAEKAALTDLRRIAVDALRPYSESVVAV